MARKCKALERAKMCPMTRAPGIRMLKESFIRTCKKNMIKCSDKKVAIGDYRVFACTACDIAALITACQSKKDESCMIGDVEGIIWINALEAKMIQETYSGRTMSQDQIKSARKRKSFRRGRPKKNTPVEASDTAVSAVVVPEKRMNEAFTDKQVKLARRRYAEETISMTKLAPEMGMSRSALGALLAFRTYKHVKCSKKVKEGIKNHKSGRHGKGGNKKKTVLSAPLVRKCRKLLSEGVSVNELSSKFGINRSTMNNAMRRRTWKTA